jgi:hypothetical protein
LVLECNNKNRFFISLGKSQKNNSSSALAPTRTQQQGKGLSALCGQAHTMSTLTPPPLPQQLFFAAGAPAKELYHDPIIPPDAYAIAFPRPNWDAIRGTLTVDAFTGIKRGYHYIQDVTKEVQDCKRHKVRLSSRIGRHITYSIAVVEH